MSAVYRDANAPAIDHRLALLRRHWQNAHRTPAGPEERQLQPGLTVALSQQAGAPAREIGVALGERLHWPVYDREVLDLIAQESGFSSELLKSVDERNTHWLVDALASFGQHKTVNSTSYAHHLAKVLAALAVHGRCIIVGRGAAVVLPPATTLRVRIVADLADRVSRVASQQSLSRIEAARTVERIDQERAKFVAHHFHRKVEDPTNFDLILNASRLPVDVCVTTILDSLQHIHAPTGS